MQNVNTNKALLVIDIQKDATASANSPYQNAQEFIDNVNSVIESSEAKGFTIVYIKQESKNHMLNRFLMRNKFIKGSDGSKIDPRVKLVSEYVYSKEKGNAFSNPELDLLLNQKKISELIIVGLDAAACVYCTSLGGLEKGYKVTVIQDAIVTKNMKLIPRILEKYKQKGILLTTVKEYI